jgi:hypothetical protein
MENLIAIEMSTNFIELSTHIHLIYLFKVKIIYFRKKSSVINGKE